MPAKAAQEYIENIKKIVDSETFKTFTTRRPKGIERKDDMPASILRRENFQLRNKNESLRRSKREIDEKITKVKHLIDHEKKGPMGGFGKRSIDKLKDIIDESTPTDLKKQNLVSENS